MKIHIKPGPRALDLAELWRARELVAFLVWRDFLVRYRQTLLGIAWALFQPVISMLVFTLIFAGHHASTGGTVAYPLYAYSGLVLWTLIARGIADGANSVANHASVVQRVYFPRLALPLAACAAAAVDFLIATLLLIPLMWHYGVTPSVQLLAAPLALLAGAATAFSFALGLSALTVRYRDVRHLLPFFLQTAVFLTPVAYPLSLLASWLERVHLPAWVLGLNPAAGAVELFRWSLFGGAFPGELLAVSGASALVIALAGAVYFRRVESTLADRL
jgi:lipopolysaccharide transport system permease protein